jgi:cobalamin biosynthesis protein CbiG
MNGKPSPIALAAGASQSAAVESFRNEMVKANDTHVAVTQAAMLLARNGQGLRAPKPKQITQD